MSRFSLEVAQNELLAADATAIEAVVSISATGSRPASEADVAVVLVVDASGSMNDPPDRMWAARLAVAEAVDSIRDGVRFAVVAGTDVARTVYPSWGRELVVADQATRHAAREAVRQLQAEGGTAMSAWLYHALDLFATTPASIRHVILVTDGENREETWKLDQALAACAGVFQADCRGVGTGWMVSELRQIASALLGSVDIIPESERMEIEFRDLVSRAMSRGVGDSALSVWCPKGATVTVLRQVSPAIEDLTLRAIQVDEFTRRYPLGAWGDEARAYHLSIEVPANEVGVEMLAARIQLTVRDAPVGRALVRAAWTADIGAASAVDPQVAHYVAQADLAATVQQGLSAWRYGDEDAAEAKLGRAARLAAASGHAAMLDLLGRVVAIDDPVDGVVRLRTDVDRADQMTLDARSTMTVPWH